jgi:hypothetical protein
MLLLPQYSYRQKSHPTAPVSSQKPGTLCQPRHPKYWRWVVISIVKSSDIAVQKKGSIFLELFVESPFSMATSRNLSSYFVHNMLRRLLATTNSSLESPDVKSPDVQAMARWIVALNLHNVDLAIPSGIGRSSLCLLFGNVNSMLPFRLSSLVISFNSPLRIMPSPRMGIFDLFRNG